MLHAPDTQVTMLGDRHRMASSGLKQLMASVITPGEISRVPGTQFGFPAVKESEFHNLPPVLYDF